MPPVVKITLKNGTNTFTSTEFDRDFKYGTADGPLLVLGSVEPAKKKSNPSRSDFGLAEGDRYQRHAVMVVKLVISY